KPVQIKGQLEEAKGISSIKLFKVVNGKPKEIANAIPQGDNKFGFQFFPDYEGLFLIGFGNEGSPGGNFKFYFKGGDKLDFIIRVDPDITYDLVGTENTKENEILAKWHKLVLPIENKSINFHRTISNYVDYFPQQEEIVAKAEGFLKEHSLGASAHFNALLGDIVQLDLATYATNFLNTPRTAHPDVSQYSPFYTALKN